MNNELISIFLFLGFFVVFCAMGGIIYLFLFHPRL